jgi:hypothetical protein
MVLLHEKCFKMMKETENILLLGSNEKLPDFLKKKILPLAPCFKGM